MTLRSCDKTHLVCSGLRYFNGSLSHVNRELVQAEQLVLNDSFGVIEGVEGRDGEYSHDGGQETLAKTGHVLLDDRLVTAFVDRGRQVLFNLVESQRDPISGVGQEAGEHRSPMSYFSEVFTFLGGKLLCSLLPESVRSGLVLMALDSEFGQDDDDKVMQLFEDDKTFHFLK